MPMYRVIAPLALSIILMTLLYLRRRSRPPCAAEPVDQTGVSYRGFVGARVRKPPWSGFTSLKNGFSGIQMVVRDRSIQVFATRPVRTLGKLLGIDYTFHASSTTMRTERIGWAGTSLFARDWIVLTPLTVGRELQLAIRPEDDSLATIWQVLSSAGVRATSPAPS